MSDKTDADAAAPAAKEFDPVKTKVPDSITKFCLSFTSDSFVY